MSVRVMQVLSWFTPDLEIYSIDEAFLGMAGFGARLESHAWALRAAVLQWTGIPVSVGIAPTHAARSQAAIRGSSASGSASSPCAWRRAARRLVPRSRARDSGPQKHHGFPLFRPAGDGALGIARSGRLLHGARGRKIAAAKSGDGKPYGVHRNQSLQTGGRAALRSMAGAVAGRDRRQRQADRRSARRPRFDLARRLPLQKRPVSCCSISIRPRRCRKGCSTRPIHRAAPRS